MYIYTHESMFSTTTVGAFSSIATSVVAARGKETVDVEGERKSDLCDGGGSFVSFLIACHLPLYSLLRVLSPVTPAHGCVRFGPPL